MKLRYYLRGLGIGMLITAMILILASDNNVSLSDEEIRARAAQLGMVESSSLTLAQMQNMKDSPKEEIPAQSQESQEAPSDKAESTGQSQASQEAMSGTSESASQSQASQETQSESGESVEQPQPSPEVQEGMSESTGQSQEAQLAEEQNQSQDNQQPSSVGVQTSAPKVEDGVEIVEITIPGGTSSGAVSRQLANAGLVESALEFDNYLCSNGYSRRIRVGTFKIPVDSQWQEIADIISTR